MKSKNKVKMKLKKKLFIIGGSFAAFLLILCLSGYLIISGYLDKVNYNSGIETFASEIQTDLELETESEGKSVPDSPQKEIDALNESIAANAANNNEPVLSDKDVINILLIGSDTRVAGANGRSDSMILLSINKKTSKIIATSLLRDIYLKIPGVALGNRLNAAYAFGGANLLLKTVQENLKISVDKYIAVDFFSFINVIDKVGGVSIDISENERLVANNYIKEINRLKGLQDEDGMIAAAGEQTLMGKQALGYSRIRYVGNADFGRTDRQRSVLEQVYSKIKQLNVVELNDLLNAFLPEVTTNLSKNELLSMILSIPAYQKYSLVSWRVPVDGSFSYMTVRKMSVLNIDFNKNRTLMQEKIYGY